MTIDEALQVLKRLHDAPGTAEQGANTYFSALLLAGAFTAEPAPHSAQCPMCDGAGRVILGTAYTKTTQIACDEILVEPTITKAQARELVAIARGGNFDLDYHFEEAWAEITGADK